MSKLERRWEHRGLICETRLHKLGHRCGYVYINRNNSLYGVDYTDLSEQPDVNGGLTYSCKIRGLWVFGFDFGHCWDLPDDDCVKYGIKNSSDERFMKSYFRDVLERKSHDGYRVATIDMAIEDCNKLAEWLDDRKDEPYVYELRLSGIKQPDEIVCGSTKYVKESTNDE